MLFDEVLDKFLQKDVYRNTDEPNLKRYPILTLYFGLLSKKFVRILSKLHQKKFNIDNLPIYQTFKV